MTLAAPALDLPAEVEEVVTRFYTCELTTLGRDGTPVTWPTLPLYRRDEGTFLVTTAIGLPQKALNVRRDPRVCLLYSDPTGSGLADPPAVLVQGDATCPEEIVTGVEELEDLFALIYRRQPASRRRADPLTRRLLDWYCMRLLIRIVPHTVSWWPGGDFARSPCRKEV